LQAKLETDFPDYIALSNPKPLAASEVQKLLAADEALAFFLVGDKESYVFALTHDAFDWQIVPLSRRELNDKVANFRKGLDVGELTASIEAGKPVFFNLDAAYSLYSILLRPVERTIKDKKYLAVVPSGALTSLPFHLLVTDPPRVPASEIKDLGPYRDAAWLLRRQAVTLLPSVSSLQALPPARRTHPAPQPFIRSPYP